MSRRKLGFSSFAGAALLAFLAVLLVAPASQADHSITELLSIGPDGGNANVPAQYDGASEDATHVFFHTDESLVASDTDNAFDVYERAGTTTRIVSVGSQEGFGLDAYFTRATPDGSHVFFHTRDQLVPQDTNNTDDIYERYNGTTSLVTSQVSGLTFYRQGATSDESTVFVGTSRQLTGADSDNSFDIYKRTGGTNGTYALISLGPTGGNGAYDVTFNGATADGSTVFFSTNESLLPADADTSRDIYQWTNGTITLISTGPSGGNGAIDANYGGISADGSHVFFTTAESLVGFPDDDTNVDVYERYNGTTKLVSYGPNSFDGPYDASFGGSSADGSRVFFNTSEPLLSADTDGQQDVYERSSGTTKLVSGDWADWGASFAGVSADGTRVFFHANHCFSSGIKMWSGGTTTTIVDTPIYCYDTNYQIQALSSDGTRVLYGPSATSGTTSEWLNGTTNTVQSDNFDAASLDGTRVVFDSTTSRLPADTDGTRDVYAASVAPTTPPPTAYPRPKGATPLRLSLVPAYKQCRGPNSSHQGPLAFPSCSPPELASNYLTIGTPTVNNKAANFVGSVRIDALPGNPSTPADEADNRFTVSMSDIRNNSDLSDYTGNVRVQATLRMADLWNGSSGTDGATVQDFPFSFNAPCSATADTTIGGSCAVVTTADTLVPGMVPEGKRTVTHVQDLRVYDGGADANPDTTGDNTLFAWEGIFTP